MAKEPEFGVSPDPVYGGALCSWTAAVEPADTVVFLARVSRVGAAGVASPVTKDRIIKVSPGVEASRSSVYVTWKEDLQGNYIWKLRAFDLLGPAGRPVEIGRVYMQRSEMFRAVSGNGFLYLGGSDFDPRLEAFYTWIARAAPSGAIEWKRQVGKPGRLEWYRSAAIISDGKSGIFAAYRRISGGDLGIVVKHFTEDGKTDWKNDSRVSLAGGYKSAPVLAPDGAGGVYVFWEDGRNGSLDIYAQRVSGTGAVLWERSGVAVARGRGNQWNPLAVADGKGGAYCFWLDDNNGSRWVLRLQRLNPSGKVLFGPMGMTACESEANQMEPAVSADENGLVEVVWVEARYGTPDIFAQKFGPGGNMIWNRDAVRVTSSRGSQTSPAVVALEDGSSIIFWKVRAAGGRWQIRAGMLDREGKEETAHKVADSRR